MCGRYASFLPAEAVARLFHTVNRLPDFSPTWNIAPTQDAMVVRRHPETGDRHLDLLNWGLLPYFSKHPVHARRPINARAEHVLRLSGHRVCFVRLSPSADVLFQQMRSMNGSLSRVANSLMQ
jgi:putative SOS response-associated peptidase YedK